MKGVSGLGEKPSILLTGYLFPMEKRIVEGYILVEDGLIVEIGEGEAPEDLRSANLHYPGRGALLLPGMASMVTHLLLYPLRGFIGEKVSFKEAWSRAEALSHRQAYTLALNTIKNMVERGVTTILSLDPNPQDIVRAVRESGVRGIIVSEHDIEVDDALLKILDPHKFLLERIEGERGATEGLVIGGETVAVRRECASSNYIGVGHNPVYDPRWVCPGLNAWELLRKLSFSPLSFFTGRSYPDGFSKGMPADMFSINPSSGLLTKDMSSSLHHAVWSTYHSPVVETVIVGGNILLDGGQQLIVSKRIVEEATEIGGLMQKGLFQ